MVSLGVVGASGYSGAVFTALAFHHPELELRFATSDKAAGERVAERIGLPDACSLQFSSHDDAVKLAREVDIVVLATSAEIAMRLAPEIATHARVVDLSGAFRLEASAYPKWYGFEHAAPAALERAFYGLPELFGSPPEGTRIVSNPGCYATAALLATAPLVRDGLAEGERVIVDGKSGISGAGRRADESYSFVELDEESRAYKIGAHQHSPEIARWLARRVTFTPHLVPVRRGLLVTAYMTAHESATNESVRASLEKHYASSPFVRVTSAERVSMHAVAGTPNALVSATVTDGMIVSVCALDNLLKGAASQAMQNVNRLFGKKETAGLDRLIRFAP